MKRLVLLMCIAGLCESANADALYEIFDFSFANDSASPGFVSGTVTGTFAIPIACLVACTNQAALYATVTDFPAGLDSVAGDAPIVFLPAQSTLPGESGPFILANSFSVTAGKFTDADLTVMYDFNSGLFPNSIVLVLDEQGTANFLYLGGKTDIGQDIVTLAVSNSEGLTGLTITPVGSVLVAPEPRPWPVLGLGLTALVALRCCRRTGSALEVAT